MKQTIITSNKPQVMIYLASPFSHPQLEVQHGRYEQVLEATAFLIRNHYVVYSPIVHNYHIASKFNLPGDFDFWKAYDLEMINRSDQVYVLTLDGWISSVGVQSEIKYAITVNKPVFLMSQVHFEVKDYEANDSHK